MLATLITNIKSSLQAVTELSVVYERPLGENEQFTGFPAVVFYPDNFTNEFLTNAENLRGYNFAMFVVTEANVKSIADATTIMANAVDAILAKFDNVWDGGVSNGHRIWQRLSQGRWEYQITETGVTIIAPLNLLVNVATNN